MNKLYTEAVAYKILRPQCAPRGKKYDEWITSSSSRWQRIAVVQLSRYLSLETGYRQDFDENVETWNTNKIETYSITEDILSKDGEERNALIGILTFLNSGPKPVLYHCYIHPFFRSKGLMDSAWDLVKAKTPHFDIEPPLSNAMKRFLHKKHDIPIQPFS
jgi:hypothetical protein